RRPPQKSASVTAPFVTLQRVPPLMRILAPGLDAPSSTTTRREGSARRAAIAVARPAAPAPITTTSDFEGIWGASGISQLGDRGPVQLARKGARGVDFSDSPQFIRTVLRG